jgi:hypothetical protein
MTNVIVFFSVFLLCCGYALWRGGVPERIGAGVFIAGMLFSRLSASSARPSFTSVEAGILIVDAAMLAAFLVLALTSRRFWPLWMTAFQLVQVAGHVARFANPDMMRWVYAIAQGIWSYPMLALLAGATWRHQRRLRLFGLDESWSRSSPRSTPSERTPGHSH